MSRSVIRGFRPDLFEEKRIGSGMSRNDLARLAGMKTSEPIRRWENGTASPQVDILKKALIAMQVPASDVVIVDPAERFLSDWRHLKLLTQPQLAQRAGLPTYQVARIERGERELMPDVEAKLSIALEIPVQEVRASYERARRRSSGPA